MKRRILVLDGAAPAAVSIVQSLGEAGYAVTLAGSSFTHRAFQSRHVAARRLCPDPLIDRPAFQTWARAQRDCELIVPATESTLLPLNEIRDDPALRGRVALPPAAAIAIAFDKERVRALAEELGIRLPANILVQSREELGAAVFDDWLARGAIVIKSTHSRVWSEDGGKELAVQMVLDRAALERHAVQMLENGPVQLQQWLPGHGIGIEVLVDRGEVVLSFAHERLHEVPLTGGGSSYRRAIDAPAELLDAAQRLLRALDWHGVAMVEFRHDPLTGDSYMMELNGRFWGSLALSRFAGIDFPRALVELLLDRKRPRQPTPRAVFARSLERDLNWIKRTARVRLDDFTRRGAPPPPERRLLLIRPLMRSLLQWHRLLIGREILDGASRTDPGPIWWEIRTQARSHFGALIRKCCAPFRHRAAVAAWQRPLDRVQRVLVLCSGNICRSAYTTELIGRRARGMDIRGAALKGPSGRRSPRAFAAAARLRGVELEAHRSHALARADIDWADLILIMDDTHRRALGARYPDALAKTRWLGAVAAPRGADPAIADPIDMDTIEVGHVLDRLEDSVDAMLRRIAR